MRPFLIPFQIHHQECCQILKNLFFRIIEPILIFSSGFQQSYIYYNTSYKSWTLQSLRDKIRSYYQDFDADYPLGRTEWKYCKMQAGNDSCLNEQKDAGIMLTFTSCNEGEFTCDSGDCLDHIRYQNPKRGKIRMRMNII